MRAIYAERFSRMPFATGTAFMAFGRPTLEGQMGDHFGGLFLGQAIFHRLVEMELDLDDLSDGYQSPWLQDFGHGVPEPGGASVP